METMRQEGIDKIALYFSFMMEAPEPMTFARP